MQIIPTQKLNLNCCNDAGKAVMNKGCILSDFSMHGLWICFTHIKKKYSYLESTLVNSSQNCRTVRTESSLTWGLLLLKEFIQWKRGSNGLPWALPNFIATRHITLQVPGLTFSHLCLARGRAAAPGRASSEIIPYLGCFHLGSAKLTFVLVISPHPSQPSVSFFLNESKYLLEERTGL